MPHLEWEKDMLWLKHVQHLRLMHAVSGNVSQVTGYQPIGKDDRKDDRLCLNYIPHSLQASTVKATSPCLK